VNNLTCVEIGLISGVICSALPALVLMICFFEYLISIITIKKSKCLGWSWVRFWPEYIHKITDDEITDVGIVGTYLIVLAATIGTCPLMWPILFLLFVLVLLISTAHIIRFLVLKFRKGN
jgi:hypothetical protein